MNLKQIQAYSLYSFAKELEEALHDGYKVLDDTIYYPQVIGNTFLATVGKSAESTERVTPSESVLSETKPIRRAKKVVDDE